MLSLLKCYSIYRKFQRIDFYIFNKTFTPQYDRIFANMSLNTFVIIFLIKFNNMPCKDTYL
jgi:hypothetical protein